ncbi:5-methyltetrahydropteroyltriglutamate--homocyste ineS-methyltransferase [Pyrolobus fumarii 1A]|uniref:Methionine synthase n=1 Tax=Pyrolobus fumarii (strain DSM 11204 / 1A) TaxID=694429 RepID=G0EFB7_PYRF1|nr:methionine synthase [Pyrolobus fumarii]AEM38160.1 5-methyltetrahydropteroyltriglutamate--homocyste ineS-methyltransferase [Pyrolobus fumarii 1A]
MSAITGYRLPKAFITTVVGSYPKMPEAEEAIRKRRQGLITEEEFHKLVQPAIKKVIEDHLEAGVDILSDGEQARDDMVVYFAERIGGYSGGEWVRIFDNVYFRKPVIVARLEYKGPMAVMDWEYATSIAQGRPVKAILTGPYTMADWSFDLQYGDRRELVLELARVLRHEIEEFVKRGAKFIQVDEPALPTRPLPEEAELVKEALEIMLKGIEVKKIVHVCFGRIEKLLPHLMEFPVDQLDLEFKNSGFKLLPYVKEYWDPRKEIGYGVIDVHSLRVESVEEIIEDVERLLKLDVIPPEKIYIDPDCGLKRLPRDVARAKLRNMVEAARQLRKKYGFEE